MSNYADRITELEVFRAHFRRATPGAQQYCFAFVRGGALSANPTLDERAGAVLACLAPAHWRHPQLVDDEDDLGLGED
jgi:hypothetical protein